ncbi:MAG: HAMP domain-containing histidine kinase [Clostridia bacterium]|nr:HAMP domain-containing histidine kinase [Clostridia bacterium]
MSEKKRKLSLSYRLIFIIVVAAILLLAASAALFALYLLINAGVLTSEDIAGRGVWIIILFVVASVIIGSIANVIVSRVLFKPFYTLIDGMEKLAGGDYSVRINVGGSGTQKELSEKFNSLAVQLENTTILRSDFINNFSHEFKTPIVSMKGLLDLLKRSDLSPTKRKQYLSVIEEELDRLVTMSTNVLNLTKIENENILTNVSRYNLSEQIRTCILLLEKKWSQKEIVFGLEFDEIYIDANEDLLKEVWINLLDNAIKFSFSGGRVGVEINDGEEALTVSISNGGAKIANEDIDKIFNKFYRAAEGGKEGNGIGLPIVKHIVELHGGKVFVTSGDLTVFTVVLYKKIEKRPAETPKRRNRYRKKKK